MQQKHTYTIFATDMQQQHEESREDREEEQETDISVISEDDEQLQLEEGPLRTSTSSPVFSTVCNDRNGIPPDQDLELESTIAFGNKSSPPTDRQLAYARLRFLYLSQLCKDTFHCSQSTKLKGSILVEYCQQNAEIFCNRYALLIMCFERWQREGDFFIDGKTLFEFIAFKKLKPLWFVVRNHLSHIERYDNLFHALFSLPSDSDSILTSYERAITLENLKW